MKSFLARALFVAAIALFSTIAVSAQSKPASNDSDDASVLNGLGKVGVFVVSSAAKSAWVTTKFTAKHLVKPTVKALLLKAPLTMLKLSGKSVKTMVPVAAKLSKAYLKTKLPI